MPLNETKETSRLAGKMKKMCVVFDKVVDNSLIGLPMPDPR